MSAASSTLFGGSGGAGGGVDDPHAVQFVTHEVRVQVARHHELVVVDALGAETVRGQALDPDVGDIDQGHVVPVEGFVVAICWLERCSL